MTRASRAESQVGGLWPTPQQVLLLRAALLPGQAAKSAWWQWRYEVDLDRLDYGSARLLPLLWRKLRELGVEDPLVARLLGSHKHWWAHTQKLIRSLLPPLGSLQDAGIPLLLLKGAALIATWPDLTGLRPMDDVDAMVPHDRFDEAARLLERAGLKFTGPSIEHAQTYHRSGGGAIDLHHRAMLELRTREVEMDFWEHSTPATWFGLDVRLPAPTEQLLHSCVHGLRWNVVPPLRWVADAMIILERGAIDWERLVRHARARGVSIPCLHALRYLRETLDAPIPEMVLRDLQVGGARWGERLDFRVRSRPNAQLGPLQASWIIWRGYQWWRTESGSEADSVEYLNALARTWNVERIGQLPAAAARRAIQRLR